MVKDDKARARKNKMIEHIRRINDVQATKIAKEHGIDKGNFFASRASLDKTEEIYNEFITKLKEAIKDK